MAKKNKTVAAFTPDTDNEMFQLAIQLVNQSNRNIFLTGKAGTGKTTFLKYIREHCLKQMAIVAPTGVAAINAGGVTIHSFFQLPLAPFIPESNGLGFQGNNEQISNKHSLISRLRFNSDKKKVLQQLQVLVIDEISMVRCDTLDAIDTVLRHVRQRPHERFGGVQVLFIGDMLQLPPVIKEQEWGLLSEYYRGQYFFDSKVLEDEPPVYVEFNKIYRQNDALFIDLLNQLRNNELNEDGVSILESRFQPAFRRRKQDGYIILTTHNDKARDINANELKKLEGKAFSYHAEVLDEFSDRAFPADEILQLKEGAQVMFIRNDSAERGKRFYNGKIGIVSRLEADKIFVQCDDDTTEIEVQKEKWENIRYTLNKNTRQLDSDVLGSFTQFPLRLAWAITIHKSQGLTFEKAIIDAGTAFAPGQVYVALSRCTNLEGMVLQSRIRSSSLSGDPRIKEFSQRSSSAPQLESELTAAKKNYLQSIIISIFDFSAVSNTVKELQEYIVGNISSFNSEALSWTDELLGILEKLQETAKKFHLQVQYLFQQQEAGKENEALQQRLKAATFYFLTEISNLLQHIQRSPGVTDSRLHSKEYNENIREVFAQLSEKKFLLEGLNGKPDIEMYHKRKREFIVPHIAVNAYAGASDRKIEGPHPVLHQQLRKARDIICSRKDLPIYLVAGSSSIDQMARYLPLSKTDLRKITGFGDAKVQQYGQEFLDVIQEYCSKHELETLIHEKDPKRERKESTTRKTGKIDTRSESFRLFNEGKTVAEIAKERNLTLQTIEGHLSVYIERGHIEIEKLVSREKLLLIEPALKEYDGKSLKIIKDKLGDEIGFGEIKMAIAWSAFKTARSTD